MVIARPPIPRESFAFRVSVHSQTDAMYRFRDFRVRAEAVDSDYRSPRGAIRRPETSELRPMSQSERDWAHVKTSLAGGADPAALIAELARSRSADKSDPQYYARLTVQKAMAELRMHSPGSDGASLPDGDDARNPQR